MKISEINNNSSSVQAALELTKLIKNPIMQLIEEIIDKRCQLVIEHALKEIIKNENQ